MIKNQIDVSIYPIFDSQYLLLNYHYGIHYQHKDIIQNNHYLVFYTE